MGPMDFLLIIILNCLPIVIGLWFKNPNHDYLVILTITLVLVPLSQLTILSSFDASIVYFAKSVLAIIGISAYTLRFLRKNQLGNYLEWLKLVAVSAFFISNIFEAKIYYLVAFPFLALTFINTRVIQLNPTNMVKNSIIALFSIMFLFLVIYSFIKATEAQELFIQSKEYQSSYMETVAKLEAVQMELDKCQTAADLQE